MDLFPGPGAFRGTLPLGPRVATPYLFESLADLVAPTLTSADAPLGAHSDQVGRDVPDNIDGEHASTAGLAEELNAQQGRVQDVTTAPQLIDTGAGAETYRTAALPYLPQPSTPITVDFTDPPPPPAPGQDGDHQPPPHEI